MGDYPDWTDLVQIVGADIMVPIDIQGAYIMMPVDIQAQYVNLDIDIVAQSVGNIAIDLVAQSVGDITVDIKAQSIEHLDIDIEAQHVGVYLQPDWTALQGKDKNFNALTAALATGFYTSAEYAVPEGKTLYITHIAGWCFSSSDVNRDEIVIMGISIYDETAGAYVFASGGNGGCATNLSKPIVIPEEHTVWLMSWNFSAHPCDVRVSAGGYEI